MFVKSGCHTENCNSTIAVYFHTMTFFLLGGSIREPMDPPHPLHQRILKMKLAHLFLKCEEPVELQFEKRQDYKCGEILELEVWHQLRQGRAQFSFLQRRP